MTLLCFFLFGAVWSEAGIEYQNAIGCELDVNCPKRWAMYAVKAKAGRVEATMPGTADHQWFWDCRKARNCEAPKSDKFILSLLSDTMRHIYINYTLGLMTFSY